MATAKKGKKTSKPKKGAKTRKKSSNNSSLNAFSKIMLTLLLLAIFASAIFLISGNFNNNDGDKQDVIKKEISIKQDNKVQKTEVKKENKVEPKKEVSEANDVKKVETKQKKEEPKKENVIKETEVKKQEPKEQSQKSETKTLSGSWLSSEQGASLTMDDYGYRIDFFGVDASKPITGNYSIENNLIVFTSDSNECDGIEGTYRITFYKKDFSLICKDDKCSSRRNVLEADWEWLEI
jgi:hypothetical protein